MASFTTSLLSTSQVLFTLNTFVSLHAVHIQKLMHNGYIYFFIQVLTTVPLFNP